MNYYGLGLAIMGSYSLEITSDSYLFYFCTTIFYDSFLISPVLRYYFLCVGSELEEFCPYPELD